MVSPTQKQVRVLFLSWRDIRHPKKGGAETYTHEVLKRLVERGFHIEHFSVLHDDAVHREVIDGVVYIRSGTNASVIPKAMLYYYRNRHRFDLVVDQCNTHRFFSSLWLPHHKRVFFIHQLTREIWYEMMDAPQAWLGNVYETISLKMNRRDNTITVSRSTKQDLLAVGFHDQRVTIAPEGLFFEPWAKEDFLPKAPTTFLYAGRLNPYKGIEVAIQSIAELRNRGRDVRLWVLGKGDPEYVNDTLKPLMQKKGLTFSEGLSDPRTKDVHIFGFVSNYDLKNLMSRAKALLFASSREGWGLTVSEAAVLGTPSVVWPSQGLIDAVHFGEAGFLCPEKTVNSMVEQVELLLDNDALYEEMRHKAYEFACTLNFDRSADVFELCLKNLTQK